MGITRPPLMAAIMKPAPKEKLGIISSFFNTLNTVGGAIGIAIAGLFIGFFSNGAAMNAVISALPVVMYICVGIYMLILLLVFFGLRYNTA